MCLDCSIENMRSELQERFADKREKKSTSATVVTGVAAPDYFRRPIDASVFDPNFPNLKAHP